MSGNEVEKLKSLRGKLAVLCPETDGLQAKHRIKRILKGKTREERVEEMLDIVADEVEERAYYDIPCEETIATRLMYFDLKKA